MAKLPNFTLAKPSTLETTLGDPAQHRDVEYIESSESVYGSLERCRLARDRRLPNAEHIQVLVQAWSQLRKSQ
jgi:hypothetical protein